MFYDDDKKAIEEIVESSLKKLLTESGLSEAAQTINDSKKITKEEIMAEKNTSKRQQLIRENMDLFTKEG